ncbi:hypothetical protein CMUS01_04778 [Colletotrichum musicola]|uniref:Uncharacterized protein n=1 Tax=Colletotrichum musicola TaxID=2175873 RepID=A0A8H6KVD7_9PEZI|nr:hypothetical protein CMUS01_04778 [Colletotrichum musicola]
MAGSSDVCAAPVTASTTSYLQVASGGSALRIESAHAGAMMWTVESGCRRGVRQVPKKRQQHLSKRSAAAAAHDDPVRRCGRDPGRDVSCRHTGVCCR